MALRATRRNLLAGADNNGPRKVEAHLVQGPTIHRTALGEVGNRQTTFSGLQHGLKSLDNKHPTIKPHVKPSGTSALVRPTGKENGGKEKKEKIIKVQEEMEVDEVAKVEELAIAFSSQQLNVEDIDSGDADNPQLVSTYVNDIYKHLRKLEADQLVNSHFLEGQSITGKMRAILVDWLVQVHVRFTLLQETLYLTVAILDRYLQKERTTPRNKLQLVGVTAMLIASKYEEMYSPEIRDFAFITDKAYSTTEIRKMEVEILKKLNFNVSYPLPLHFLRRNSKAGCVDASQHMLAKYLMELCLPEYSMCHYRPSVIAGAALCLSLKLMDSLPWTDTLSFYSGYTEEELMPVVCKLAAIVIKSNANKLQAVRRKYRSTKQLKISDCEPLKSKLVTRLAERASLT